MILPKCRALLNTISSSYYSFGMTRTSLMNKICFWKKRRNEPILHFLLHNILNRFNSEWVNLHKEHLHHIPSPLLLWLQSVFLLFRAHWCLLSGPFLDPHKQSFVIICMLTEAAYSGLTLQLVWTASCVLEQTLQHMTDFKQNFKILFELIVNTQLLKCSLWNLFLQNSLCKLAQLAVICYSVFFRGLQHTMFVFNSKMKQYM